MNFDPWCTYSNKCQFFVWQFVIHDVLFFHIRECPHAEHLQHLSNVNWNIFSYSNIESVLSESFRSISNTSSKALCGKRQGIFSAWTGITNRLFQNLSKANWNNMRCSNIESGLLRESSSNFEYPIDRSLRKEAGHIFSMDGAYKPSSFLFRSIFPSRLG